ncbi:MAG: hypothetical protein Q7U08_03005 [Flavobacteriaceae bacterium]|nr:hypothetical protein [Flavobacteriaceae bacterium]
MKNILFTLITIISINNVISQNIMSFDEVIDKGGFFKEGYYMKDTKNELDKYVGVWKGTFNQNTYEFRIEKHLKYNDGDFYLDKLFVRSLIKDINGIILLNTLTTPLEDLFFNGEVFTNKNYDTYQLMYIEDMKCNLQGDVYFTIFENNTKIKLNLYIPFNLVTKDECADINKHSLLPESRINEYMILTKQ